MTNSEIIKLFNVDESTVLNAYNNSSWEKASSITNLKIFVLDDKLSLVYSGNGESLLQFDGSKFVEKTY